MEKQSKTSGTVNILFNSFDITILSTFQTSTTDSDVEEANIEDNLIDLDDMDDDFLDVEKF